MKHHPQRAQTRRNFLAQSAVLSLASLLPNSLAAALPSSAMGVVVHSYGQRWQGKYGSEISIPPFQSALDLLEHCHAIGAGGIQVTVGSWTEDFAKKVRDAREKKGMYLEGSIALPKEANDLARFEGELRLAKEAGAGILRSVCLPSRRYETFHTLAEFQAFKQKSIQSLQLAAPLLAKHRVALALENHKDWQAEELRDLMQSLSSEWIGVTLDFGNNLALLENPMHVIRTLAPYAISTHVKDMGLAPYERGFLLSEVPLGQGILPLADIVALCKSHRPDIRFNLEMITRDPLEIPCLDSAYWATFPHRSALDLTQAMALVKEKAFSGPLPSIKGKSKWAQLQLEENHILACLTYSKETLKLHESH